MIDINKMNIMHLVVTEKTIDFVSNGIIVEGEPLVEKSWWELKFSMMITLLFIDKAIFDDQGTINDDFWIAESRYEKE